MEEEVEDLKRENECLKDRISELESKNFKLEIVRIVMTPKMFLAICLGMSFIFQMLKGA